MRITITTIGRTVFFPDATRLSPSPLDLQAIADRVYPNVLLLFASCLVRSVRCRRRRQVTTAAPIQHRVELLRLCLERALRNGEV